MADENTRAVLHFCGHRLDPVEGQLRCGAQTIDLRPKTLAVLAYLAARPGHLVTKDELLDAIWAETSVGEWVLTASVKELRQALGDDARQPRIIETHYGRGYRFIAAVHTTDPEASETASATSESACTVGRAADLAVLDGWLEHAWGASGKSDSSSGRQGSARRRCLMSFSGG